VQNILKNPKNLKFRTIKKSNKAIQSKLYNLKPLERIEELLNLLGYEKVDDDTFQFEGH